MSSLSKTAALGIGLIVIVAIAGGAMYFTKREPAAFSGTMFDLFDRGGNWECSWEQVTGDLAANGVVFISGKKFKSDTVSSSGTVTLDAHALSDGEFFYAWTNLAPIGIRTNLIDLKKEAEKNTPQTGEFGDEYTFDCKPWNADQSVFAIPTDVVFSSLPAAQQ